MRVVALNLLCVLSLAACTTDLRPLVREANLPNIAAQRQQELAGSNQWQVRRAIAGNRHSAPALLERLASDPDPRVRIAVATNISSPESARRALARDPRVEVRSVVARFEYVSADTLAILARDGEAEIRQAVAGNWNTSPETLERLTRDPYESVAHRARQELDKRRAEGTATR